MKRCLLLLLVLLLLTACTPAQPEQTQPVTETRPTETTPRETAPSLIDPAASITKKTDGAVAAITLEEGICDLAFMGDQPLILYNDGSGNTRIVRLERERCSVETAVVVPGMIYSNTCDFRATGEELAYYHEEENAVILLDHMLREISRTVMPEDMTDLPLVCEDMQTVIYPAGSELRVMDMETGISRPLRQRDCQWINLIDSHFADSVLLCGVSLENGEYIYEFISTENGETLGIDPEFNVMESWQDTYFLQRTEGVVQELLFAKGDASLQAIVPLEEHNTYMAGALPMNAVVSVGFRENGSSLALYDLESGKNTAFVELKGLFDIYGLVADPSGQYLWFFGHDRDEQVSLYRWEPAASGVKDNTVYTSPRYTEASPDLEGLAECRSRADALEETYGITIHLEGQMPGTEDYSFTYEFHPQALSWALDQLEETLAQFPEAFFTKLGTISNDGKVHIGFVRGMTGRTAHSVPDALGVQYWADSNAAIALKIDYDIAGTFYHELAHVLDTFILNEALAFDDWEDLNPRGFDYDGNYSDYLTREDSTWWEGENRAVIDGYSMSYPKEDRARIFEYAMQEGNEELFASEILQKKLIQVCKGIRDAFGLKKDERTFPWEQYLEKSLAYKKK